MGAQQSQQGTMPQECCHVGLHCVYRMVNYVLHLLGLRYFLMYFRFASCIADMALDVPHIAAYR